MHKVKSTIFNISKEEVEEIFNEMIENKRLRNNLKLNRKQIVTILDYIECDELLAKDIRISIEESIIEALH